jgi:hypothetical protein
MMGKQSPKLAPDARFLRGQARPLTFNTGPTVSGRLSPTNVLTVKIRQPSHEFTFGVGMNFILYPLVLTPVV